MKHPKQITYELLAWLVGAFIFIILTLGKFSEAFEGSPPNPLVFGLILILTMAAGTVFWLKVKSRAVMVYGFSLGIALLIARAFTLIFNLSVYVRIIIAIPLMFLYAHVMNQIFKGNIKKWYAINNIIMILMTAVLGGTLASLLPLQYVLILFVLFAIYDAWAVWKTKHMIVLASNLINNGIIPGISVPKQNRKRKLTDSIALLGAGDLFILALVTTAFATINWILAFVVGVGMIASLVWLFLYSSPKKFYPALPYMFAGMAGGISLFKLIAFMVGVQ